MLVEALSLELGPHTPCPAVAGHGPAMPMTWGIRGGHSAPCRSRRLDAERRRDVLLHELAHVKRHDFSHPADRPHCDAPVYWFHPLVWLAATRLREERERGVTITCCARARHRRRTPRICSTSRAACGRRAPRRSPASPMARPAQLATRLIDVLDTRRCRDTLSRRSAIPAWIAAIAVVVPLARRGAQGR